MLCLVESSGGVNKSQWKQKVEYHFSKFHTFFMGFLLKPTGSLRTSILKVFQVR